MRDISFTDCVEFQDCFLFDGKFSPFENVGDFRKYYPRVLIGEIGGLLNLSCKVPRSANTYDDEIKDECADIFIYLLLFGRMLEIHDQKQVLCLIGKNWNEPVTVVLTEEEYYNECVGMIEKVCCFLKSGKEQYYNEGYFYEIFLSIQQASKFITKQNWQHIINKFHEQVIQKHTDVSHFTPDGLYKGGCRINIDNLLYFTRSVGVELPEKRIEFLQRMQVIQSKFQPDLSSREPMKSTNANNLSCDALPYRNSRRRYSS
jgi:hypothetical protein